MKYPLAGATLLFLVTTLAAAATRDTRLRWTPIDDGGSLQRDVIALASADLDEDGSPDLLALGSEKRLTWQRALPDAGAGPRFAPSRDLARLDASVDSLLTGDFDADGHLDVVLTSRGGGALHWLRGNGRGALLPHAGATAASEVATIELGGEMTAWSIGEVNRRDGLADLVVAVEGSGAPPRLLVFEHPAGALRAAPEVLELPAPATALVLAQLDDQPWREIVAVAGRELVVYEGRDRALSTGRRALAAVSQRLSLDRTIESVTAGDFVPDAFGRSELAVRMGGKTAVLQRQVVRASSASATRTSDTAATSPREGSGRAVPRNRFGANDLEERSEMPSRDVNAVGRSLPAAVGWREIAPDSLPRASVRALRGLDGAGADLPDLASARAVLPVRTNASSLDRVAATESGLVVIEQGSLTTFVVNSTEDTDDGACSPLGVGTDCTLREAMLAALATNELDQIEFDIPGAGPHTIALTSVLPVVFEPVIIDGTTEPGATENTDPIAFNAIIQIVLDGSALPTVGASDALSFGDGAAGSVVRGLAINNFPDDGIEIFSDSVTLEGNLIGLEPDGDTIASLGGTAVQLFSSNNVVGGTAASARNVISGSGDLAIHVALGASNVIQGNLIGTDATGLENRSETEGSGIMIDNSPSNTVGGTAAGARNVISGSGESGLCFCNFTSDPPLATGNLAQGNFIGVDATGTTAIANGLGGAWSFHGSGNTFGGTTPAARNVISGNGGAAGIVMGAESALVANSNLIQGNFIGTDAAGTSAIPNLGGIQVFEGATGNTIGGLDDTAANVVSGNAGIGIQLLDSTAAGLVVTDNTIRRNRIGVDLTDTLAIPNSLDGIELAGATSTDVLENRIRANGFSGVFVTDTDGGGAMGNTIGLNAITHNGFDGVTIFGNLNVSNAIQANSIHDNDQLAIDLVADGGVSFGPDTNDAFDADDGGNGLQNYPVLGAVPPAAASVGGTLHSEPSSPYEIALFEVEACDPSGYGEADTPLDSQVVTTDANGDASFSFNLASPPAEGDLFTATARNTTTGDTSELSLCRESCVEVVDLPSATVSTELVVTACETILAAGSGETYVIEATGDVTFRAGQSVEIGDGLAVQVGGAFLVRIEPNLQSP